MHKEVIVLLSIYAILSLVFTMRAKWWLRLLLALPLLLGGFRSIILDWLWRGNTFFLPEAPRLVLMWGSILFVFLVLALSLVFIRDLIAGITWIVCFFKKSSRYPFPYRKSSVVVYALCALLTGWSMWDSMRVPAVKEISISIENLPAEYKGLRVVVLADLHLAQLNDAPYAEEIVRRTNALEPDLIVLPGDLIDGDVSLRRDEVAPLAGLKAKYGVYMSLGNHEYYSGIHPWLAEFRRLGIIPLINENVEVLPKLFLAGVGDVAGYLSSTDNLKRWGSYPTPGIDYDQATKGVNGCVIMLAHRPDLAPLGAKYGVDLQIAGHTHGGMLLGFDQIVALYNGGYVSGHYQGIDGSKTQLYVSNGAGIWPGFTMRVGVSGEITLITLN